MKITAKLICLIFMGKVLTGCNTRNEKNTLLELLPAPYTGIDFSNEIEESNGLNILTFEYFYNGAGVGIGDFNNDSLPDIFFGSNMGKSRLYINRGKLKFSDATDSSGINTAGKWATGVSVVDINQDGLQDIYLCFAGPHTSGKRANELYINQGNGRFTENSQQFGLADTGHSVQAAFLDYDRDGDLDMYLLTNITDATGPNVIRKKRDNGEMANTDRLYRNNGNNSFTNVSKEAGIIKEGYGLGVSVSDINNDGWPDIYVSNDYISNDLLYINNQNGTFTDIAATAFGHTSYSAMGNDVADFNNDALADIFAVDMLPPDQYRQKLMLGATNHDRYRSEIQYGYSPQFMRNTLQLNVSGSCDTTVRFSEIGQYAGVDATDWSWATLFADLDNDGWRDLLVTNGYPRDITNKDFINYQAQERMQSVQGGTLNEKTMAALKQLDGAKLNNYIFRNRGELTFEDVSQQWGLDDIAYSSGAAYADLDNDGDLDLVISNTGSPAAVYKNNAERFRNNHYLNVQLQGPNGNKDGFGTKIYLHCDSLLIYHEQQPVRGYQSSVAQSAHFGLGANKTIDSLTVIWPDGRHQRLQNIQVDQQIFLRYEDSDSLPQPIAPQQPHKLFQQLKTKNINFKHRETPYTDFNNQPLMPHKFSQGGPGIAVADVNGDGLDDFFVGGAYNQSGEIFIQTLTGNFTSKPLTTAKKYEEDMGALFFDADNDGDADLYVVSGGNEFDAGSPYFNDRLYINDGRGNFRRGELPANGTSGSCVIAADFDGDGDLDLFRGGRLKPQHYPTGGISQLLRNDNGTFTDVTNEYARGLRNIGMVNAAVWSDIDNDNYIDLIIVGEWMPITVFKNNGKQFTNVTSQLGLSETVGWWNSIAAADIDGDGRIDYVLGNAGHNSRYRTSSEEPLSIYVSDFSYTGTEHGIITYRSRGKEYPIHPRDDLMQQLPGLRKKFPSYSDYANATFSEIFGADALSKARQTKAHTFSSSVLHNTGDSAWRLTELPAKAQFAPVFGIAVEDFDGDGYADIILSGNDYSTEVINGRQDALQGLFLHGFGNFTFAAGSSGFCVPGDGKAIAGLFNRNNVPLILASQNNDSILAYTAPKTSALVTLQKSDAVAVIQLKNGKTIRKELTYGSGYLSQSSRRLAVPENAVSVTITTYTGLKRTVKM